MWHWVNCLDLQLARFDSYSLSWSERAFVCVSVTPYAGMDCCTAGAAGALVPFRTGGDVGVVARSA